MSFPETVDEILDVSEDEGRLVCFGSGKTRHMQNFESIHFQLWIPILIEEKCLEYTMTNQKFNVVLCLVTYNWFLLFIS